MSTNTYYFYKIHNPLLPFCYIGRTRDPKTRLSTHKHRCLSRNTELYKTIRENGGWSSGWKFDVLETCEMTAQESMMRERELYESNNANLNMIVPNYNHKSYSYYQEHKETLRIKARNKYQKTKTVWKYPKVSTEYKKALALRKASNYGHMPTQLTMEKHGITNEELNDALLKGGWIIHK